MSAPLSKLRIFVVLLGVVAIGITIWSLLYSGKARGMKGRDLPMSSYGEIAPFSLTERSGATVQNDDLKGRVWVADFIFTRCGGPCPLLSQKMAKLQDKMKDELDLSFVSFTVDPDYDTPSVLSAYADKYGADPKRWLFLTGETQSVRRLILDSFRLSVRDNPNPDHEDGEEVVHSLKFALVDRQGKIRGYYTGTEMDDMRRLMRDVRYLLTEKKALQQKGV